MTEKQVQKHGQGEDAPLTKISFLDPLKSSELTTIINLKYTQNGHDKKFSQKSSLTRWQNQPIHAVLYSKSAVKARLFFSQIC